MSKRNIFLAVVAFVVIAIVVVLQVFALPSLRVATGYAAKYVCSATFVSNLNPEIITSDLDLGVVNEVDYEIDHENKSVKGTFLGLGAQTAYYYENENGCGCYLADEKPVYEEYPSRKSISYYKENSTVFWPVGDKVSDTILPDIDQKRLNTIVNETLKKNDAARALLVCYKNYLLAEGYADGINKNTRLLGWSMTKTMTNALIGNMVKNEMLDIYQPTGIEEWTNDERREITVDNLLHMSSGLDWEENYGKLSGVTRMLFHNPDMYAYSISPQVRSNPNEEWVYSSGTTNILSGLMKSYFETEEEYLAFPYDSLFDVLGMKSAVVETDPANTYVFSSFGWATARDWARFGLLYLYKGDWFGKKVFNADWAEYSVTAADASNGKYGAQIWLNLPQDDMPNAPADAFYEDGFGGQRVLIVPSKDLVVVLLSGQQKDFSFDQFIKEVLDCFE